MDDKFITMLDMMNGIIQHQDRCLKSQNRDMHDLSERLSSQTYQHSIATSRLKVEHQQELGRVIEELKKVKYDLGKKEQDLFVTQGRCDDLQAELNNLPKKRETMANDYMRHTGLFSPNDKIIHIKAIRTITGWGLKEAKDYVESWSDK